MMRNDKNVGIRLTKKEMKNLKGGLADSRSTGCLPFQYFCYGGDNCCPLWDDISVMCTSRSPSEIGSCTVIVPNPGPIGP